MEIGPIWRAMLKNKAGFVLIALQIAVTMTIIVNAVGIIQERRNALGRDSGLDEANTFAIVSVAFEEETEANRALIDADLDLIRNHPGVQSAVATNSFPLRQGGWSMSLRTTPAGEDGESVGTAIYFVDEHGLETFGTELVEGQNFTPNQVNWNDPEDNTWPATAIITEALAKEIFPDEDGSIIGKTVFINDDDPVNIVGIVDRLQAPWQGWSGVERSMLVPQRRGSSFQRYVIRAEPGYRDEIMPQIEEMLASSNKDRLIRDMVTMDHVRKLAYLGDAALVKILLFVVTLLVLITGLGIVGLASFNVSRRTRQIGIRRALGATKHAIVRYFMIENFIVSSIGVVFGGILAVGLNILLVETFSLEPLSWYVIPAAMIALWIVGQAAVAGPARRASNISPAIATRSS